MAAFFTRFLPFAKVAAWLIFWLISVNLVLMALSKTTLLDWLPDRSSGVGFLLESRQRVDAATAAYESRAIADDRPLAAVVGISDVREGVRLDTLTSAMHNRWRFVGVAGAGAGMASVEEQAALVSEGRLRPDVVIIGISPLQMVESANFERGAAQVDETKDGKLAKLRAKMRGALWLVNRRSDMNGWLDRVMLDGRNGMAEAVGLERTVDTRSPWRPMLRTLGMEHYPDSVLQRGLQVAEASGARDAATFASSKGPYAAVAKMVGRFEGQGERVVLIMMPRHPWFEAILPPSVDSLIASRLRGASANPNLLILDYSKAVPASGFIDLVHLNTVGGETFSKQLAGDLMKLNIDRNIRRERVRS